MDLPLVQGLGLRKHLRTRGRFRDPFKKVRPEERPSQTVEGWRTFLAHPPLPTSGSSLLTGSVWEMTGLARLGQSQLRSPKQRGSTQSLSSQSGQTMVLPAWGGRWTPVCGPAVGLHAWVTGECLPDPRHFCLQFSHHLQEGHHRHGMQERRLRSRPAVCPRSQAARVTLKLQMVGLSLPPLFLLLPLPLLFPLPCPYPSFASLKHVLFILFYLRVHP